MIRHRSAVPGLCGILVIALVVATASAQVTPLAVVPFDEVDSHIVIPVSVDGSEPLNFVFDNASGGTVLDSSAADVLGLAGPDAGAAVPAVVGQGDGGVVPDGAVPEGVVQVQGGAIQIVGGQAVMVDSASAAQMVAGSSGIVMGGPSSYAQIALGGLVLDDVQVSVLPLSHLTMPTGEPVDGIIGYDILKRFVVEVDNEAHVLRVFDRDAYEPRESATRHDVTFLLGNMAQPCVAGDIALPDGSVASGMFVLDAGAGADVVLNSPFVAEHDLIAELDVAGVPLESVSGVTPDRSSVVRGVLPGFTFCGATLSSVPVTLNLGTVGFLAGEGYAGVIGNRILNRFNIAYDYVDGVVYLEPISSS